MILRLLGLLLIIILVDIYTYFGLLRLTRTNTGKPMRRIILSLHILTSIGFIVAFLIHFIFNGTPGLDYIKFRSYFTYFGIFLLLYIPKIAFSIFLFVDDIITVITKPFRRKKSYMVKRKRPKSIRFFIYPGLIIGIVLFGAVGYGIIWGKSDFKIHDEIISFPNLPESFNGLRIMQISDLHLGSFYSTKALEKAIKIIKAQKVDLILFTGDLVNNVAAETNDYYYILQGMRASLGKYSILGNHDMGDYMKWDSEKANKDNLAKLISFQENVMGFTMLLNKNVIIYRGSDSIALIGVENWGLPPFKKYGNLNVALSEVKAIPFKILLTHDPNHWKAEVVDLTDISLTLSGHTHGGQFGINSPNFKFSPISLLQKNWAGLYNKGNQYLYVNQGLGLIGFPGRVGINPEITIITLRRKSL